MSVYIGDVETFEDVRPDKRQALKVVEEAAEVFGAWQAWDAAEIGGESSSLAALVAECADVIQATCNLIDALGEGCFDDVMEECAERNRERGRM